MSTTAVFAEEDEVDKAVKEYNAGNIDRALPLLIDAVKKDDKNGKAHYYLGLAEQKLGQKADGIRQLETAVKLLPTGMVQSMAKQALSDANGTPEQQQQQQGWFNLQNMGNNIWNFFGGGQKTPTGAAPAKPAEPWFKPPDIFKPMRDMAPDWFHGHDNSTHPSGISGASIMHMGEMQGYVEQSHHNAKWVSDPVGVTSFFEAPGLDQNWNVWIWRFRRAINLVLTRHMLHDLTNETTGKAAVVFSLDKDGNLKGYIYATTADDALNKCLVDSIKALNHNKWLEFPPSSHIKGWNFAMKWDFARLLDYIRIVRARQKELETKMAMTSTDAKLKANAKGAHATIGKLPKTKKETKVAVIVPAVSVKTGVSGQIMPKAKPVELKAKPLSLTDVIGKNVLPPPDFEDVLDAMNLDALETEREMDEEQLLKEEERAKREKGELPADTPPNPPEGTQPVAPAEQH
jgi:hypothetical protein